MSLPETQNLSAGKSSGLWLALAEQLHARLQKAGPGKRESVTSEFGGEHHLKVDTLRAYLIARRYIENLATEEPALAQSLRTASVDAIRALARWGQYDTTGSMEACRKVASGKMSISQVKRAAAAARGDGVRGSPKLTFIARILN